MEEKNKIIFPESSSFGARFRKLRLLNKLSQCELASKLGYKRSGTISNIESDKTPPTVDTLLKISELFDADIHWLVTGNCSPTTKQVVNIFKPFIYAHLNDVTKKMMELAKEPGHSDEIQNNRLYCKAIIDHLNEVLKSVGEEI